MENASSIVAGVAALRTLKVLDKRIRYAAFCKIVGWKNVRTIGVLLDLIAASSPASRGDLGQVVGANGRPGAGINHRARVQRT